MDTSLFTHACISKNKFDYPQLTLPIRYPDLQHSDFRVLPHMKGIMYESRVDRRATRSLAVKRRTEKVPPHSYNPGQFSEFFVFFEPQWLTKPKSQVTQHNFFIFKI